MCLGFRDSFAVTRRGKGNDADAAPTFSACAEPGEGPRLITSIADCDPGTLDISGKSSFVPTPAKRRPSPLYPAIP